MATYEYDFAAFESSAARKLRMKEENQIKPPKLIKLEAEPPAQKDPQQLKNEQKKAKIKFIRRVFFLSIFASLVMTYIYAVYCCDSIDRQISSLTTDYDMVCGENIEYEMRLNNMVSLEQIEKIAVEELGLVKLNSSDIEFVRLVGENKVLVTQARK